MISKVKDDNGRIIAFLEWRQVGQSGFDKLRGEYLWVNDLWIHKDYKNSWDTYKSLMSDALFKAMDAQSIYFKREKYNGRISKLYSRERIMNMLDRTSVGV